MQEIQQVCDLYRLGEMIAPPEVVTGGTLHRIWRVKTKVGDFAVKRLNKDHYTLLGTQYLNTDQTQHIVDELLAANIQTHQAIRHHEGYECELNKASWVVFKWVEGECIDQTRLSAIRAFKIGELLAKLHAVNVTLPALQPPVSKGLTTHEWHLIAEQGLQHQMSWADTICSHLGDLDRWRQESRQAIGALSDRFVISHRDLNIFNIIWTPTEEPVMIDWELGGLVHPYNEVFVVAMNWSFTGSMILESAFKAVFSGYQFPRSFDITPMLRSYQGYLLDWLIFNVRRSLAYPEQQEIAKSEINYVVSVLNYLDQCDISLLQQLVDA